MSSHTVGEETWPEKEYGMEHKDQQDLACWLTAKSFIKVCTSSTIYTKMMTCMCVILKQVGMCIVNPELSLVSYTFQLEARSTFTNLLRLPAMLKRLPLPDYAVYAANAGISHVGSGTESCAQSASGALEGVALHIMPHAHSARISILYKLVPFRHTIMFAHFGHVTIIISRV